MDLYLVRSSIFSFIQSQTNHLQGKLLDTGCGRMPYRSYILDHSSVTEYHGLDIETAINYSDEVKPDVTWDGKTMPFENNLFDCAFATEVLEHVPDPLNFLSETNRVLKPGSIFFFTVPFLWPLHEPPHDEYRYTPFAIKRLLQSTGFHDISVSALGGWNASLGQMLGLWIKRAPMSRNKKKWLGKLILPIQKYLYKHDNPDVDFLRGPMITGLCGYAYKQQTS